ncbi:hypothetical protein RB595_000809 [Gaeumannomyces hyphopodioides]
MSFQGLQERLAQLQETTSQLKTLIDRLASLKFQPGSVPLADGGDGGAADGGYVDGNVVSELGADITQGLRETDEELELLREELLDLRPGRPGSEVEKTKARLKDAADRLRQELKAYRISFRKAQLSARERMAAALRAERAALLASYTTPPVSSAATTRSGASSPAPSQQQQPTRRRQTLKNDRGGGGGGGSNSSKGDKVVGAATDVTASLQRTHDLMAAELARSAYAAQALAESTAALRELDDRYTGLDGMLAASRSLLGTLVRSQKSDTWYLRTTLYLLLATAAWLVFRRLLYGPLWWLLWVPLRVGWWSAAKGVGGGMALVGSRQPAAARMEVVGASGSTSVVGMAGDSAEALPTVGVAHGGDKEKGSAGPDSMMDKVGRIIDGDGDVAAPSENENSDAPNPKKRMWEEPVESDQDASRPGEGEHSERGRIKDEL